MMPGVVAGFPDAAPPKTVGTVTSVETDYSSYGYVASGGMIPPYGSMSPLGFRAIPKAPPLPGAPGDIIQLLWYGDPFYEVELVIRGQYASANQVPFSRMIIDGAGFDRGDIVSVGFVPEASVSFMRWASVTTNPLTVGEHVVEFL